MPRHLILRLPAGSGHVLWSGRDFLGGPERVYLFPTAEALVAHVGGTVPSSPDPSGDGPVAGAEVRPDDGAHPAEAPAGHPASEGTPAGRPSPEEDRDTAPVPVVEVFDLFGIGRILAASLPTEARPQFLNPAGGWEPLPADSTGAVAPEALDAAVTMLGALFASRGRPLALLAAPRVLAATSLVTEAAERAGRLDAGVLGAVAAPHRYRAVSWWWQVLEATERIMDRRNPTSS
ncbi:hypothetical protein AB0M43_18725 [Longispora sp. NPDC051575]|uniref:hypothetical protein n=1 Tax=Longispora sp. NPDC051575 TaxID=3154943 RepID=UPI00342DA7E3